MRYLLVDDEGAVKMTDVLLQQDIAAYALADVTAIIDLNEAKYFDIEGRWADIEIRKTPNIVNESDKVFVPVSEPKTQNEVSQEEIKNNLPDSDNIVTVNNAEPHDTQVLGRLETAKIPAQMAITPTLFEETGQKQVAKKGRPKKVN